MDQSEEAAQGLRLQGLSGINVEDLGRCLATALAESSDLLDVAEQVATALEDLANRDALQAGRHAPGAGTYSPTFEPPLDASLDHYIGMLSDDSSKTGATLNELAPREAEVITLKVRHSPHQATLRDSALQLLPDTDSHRSMDEPPGPGLPPLFR